MTLVEQIQLLAQQKEEKIWQLNQKVWEYAELNWQEFRSAEATALALEEEGFTVTRNAANLPTAIVAHYGTQGPTIGFLGEYDALPGLSQQAGCPEHQVLETGAAGHGCGHSMLGAGAFGAAVLLKELIANGTITAQVEFFGCPAEEDGAGKAHMAREGLFQHLDAIFTWHPDSANHVMGTSTLAVMGVEYSFTGITAHAAGAPYAGRSALDAAELMNVGCNYLREHMIPEAKLHYAYRDTGGTAPNVVPAHAALHYYIRAPKVSQMLELFQRVNKVAQGAALMTETQVKWKIIDACSDFIPNRPLSQLLAESLAELGAPAFDEQDQQLAKKFQATIPERQQQENLSNSCLSSGLRYADYQGLALDNHTPAYIHQPQHAEMGSTDVGDASYCAPTAQCYLACCALGTGGHTWQFIAQSNSSIGKKGTIQAAKVMALAAAKAASSPEQLALAKQEFLQDVPNGYTCPLPAPEQKEGEQ